MSNWPVAGGSATLYPNATGPRNVALQANGATITASSTVNSNFPVEAAITGDRQGVGWAAGHGGWNGTYQTTPEWLEVTFAGSRTIDRINVFTKQNHPNTSVPTLSMTTAEGITDFLVQTWNGSSWVTQATVTGNDKVWREFTFSAVTTDKIRLYITAYTQDYARVVELEAWEVGAQSYSHNPGNVIMGLAGANTWSGWYTVIPETAYPGESLTVTWATQHWTRSILQLAIGADGSEQVIATIPHFPTDNGIGSARQAYSFTIPVRVPRGVRVSARVRIAMNPGSAWSGDANYVTVVPSGPSALFPRGGTCLEVVGVNIGGTAGTTIAAGADEFGAWVELTDSFNFRPIALGVGVGHLGYNGGWGFFAEVGVGGAGAEVTVARMDMNSRFQDWSTVPSVPLVPVNFPAQQRIAARAQGSPGAPNIYLFAYALR